MQDSTQVNADPGSVVYLNVDTKVAEKFLAAIQRNNWLSAVSFVGFIVALFAIWIGINHLYVLQYDLMDLRAKTGHAHENTPSPLEEAMDLNQDIVGEDDSQEEGVSE